MLDDALHDAMDLSKLRCESDHRLERGGVLKPRRLSEYEIQERRQALAPLLGRNAGSVTKLRTLAKEAGYCMLITDADCVVVQDYADSVDAQAIARSGLKCGTVWHEARAGTNGLGLCAETRRVLTVAGQDHFFDAFHKLGCTAAPILDDENALLGIINVTGTNHSFDVNGGFVRQIMGDISEHLQSDMFRRAVGSDLLIEVRDGVTSRPNALLSLSPDGTIAKITPSAAEVLASGTPVADLRGQAISNFIPAEIDDLLPMVGRTQYFELHGPGACFVTPQVPAGSTVRATAKRGARSSKKANRASDRKSADPKMHHIYELSARMLRNGIAVVLEGAAGAGKLSVAQALHQELGVEGGRAIMIDCAVVEPDDLAAQIEDFLNVPDHQVPEDMFIPGKTLILREIGSLPARQQAQLFSLLSSAGAGQEKYRIISTTSTPLQTLSERDILMPALLHVLKGAAMTIPSLMDRSDLESVVQGSLASVAQRDVALSHEARAALLSYAWPGNIPELTNALRFAMACCIGARIELEDLPQEIRATPAQDLRVTSASIPPVRMASTRSLNQSRVDAENQRIRQALLTSGWNVSYAAKTIGVSRATMHRKMKEFGIERPSRQAI